MSPRRSAPSRTARLIDAATRIAFTGDAKVSGLALADPALNRAVGPDLTLTMRGAASPDGEMTFDALDLVAPSLNAHFPVFSAARKFTASSTSRRAT